MSASDQSDNETYEELPEPSEILGLLEVIRDKGGRDDIYKLSSELQMELGELLNVIKAAELLKLVHTPGGDVVLEQLGEEVSDSDVNERKLIINRQVREIPLFRMTWDFLKAQEELECTKDELLEKLGELVPDQNVETLFGNLLKWGRYAELFGYNDDTQDFYIETETDTYRLLEKEENS